MLERYKRNMRIFSKLNSNEYNNQMEKILENKTFDESVKNLLLSMLYKIENGYADYSIVKFNALPKADFMEKILNIIDKQCFEIKLVIPETEESKPLEHDNVVCKIDTDRGSIFGICKWGENFIFFNSDEFVTGKVQQKSIGNNRE